MNITMEHLESYLQDIRLEENPMVFDDEMPGDFDDFVSNLDYYDVLAFAKQLIKANIENGFELGEATLFAHATRLADAYCIQNGIPV